MSVRIVDMRSDTVTKPTAEMRKAMAEAEVGDDVKKEDPTVKKLENYAAELFGKEAALFVPSGTMGNLVSVMSHCWTRGQQVLFGDKSHMALYEQGGCAQLAGVFPKTLLTNKDGTLDIDEMIDKMGQKDDCHFANTGLMCLENTHNRCGGVILPLPYIEQAGQLCRSYEVPLHMDGARIMNASVKMGIPVREILKNCDSVSACLSKGLAAPVGSVIAGSKEFIDRAVLCRKVLGGGMRQAGVIAAAGYVALTSMVDRLEEDHRHAEMLAKAIYRTESNSITVDLQSVQTNIVMVDVNPAILTSEDLATRLGKVNNWEKDELEELVLVKASCPSSTQMRFVLNNDVSSDDTRLAIEKVLFVINEADRKQ